MIRCTHRNAVRYAETGGGLCAQVQKAFPNQGHNLVDPRVGTHSVWSRILQRSKYINPNLGRRPQALAVGHEQLDGRRDFAAELAFEGAHENRVATHEPAGGGSNA